MDFICRNIHFLHIDTAILNIRTMILNIGTAVLNIRAIGGAT
jgi:hypothetical protein